ncbi:MAG: glycosyltransferase family 4 protein [Vicinamibacterales bacterium]
MRKLRVALVAPSLDILGGQAVQADRLIAAWRDDPEVDCRLVPVNPVPPGPLRHACRVKYARTLATEATYGPLLLRELSRVDIAHVFSASYTSFLLAPLPAVAVARLLGRPVILNYRSGEAPDHLARSAVARTVLRRVDHNVVPSRFLVDVFARHGIDASVIPNVVDTERFRFRARTPLRPRLLCTRNLEPLYNVACTLRAFRRIQDRWPGATLTLVGSGSEEPRIRALAGELDLHGVTFAGRVAPGRIHEYYADHDIYLQSPDIDNMPASLLEAFASGLPVVSTDVGGIRAILTPGEHGLLAPADDHDGLAAHVLTLLEEPAFGERLARQAHATCAARTWPVLRDQWLRLYRSVLPSTAAHATVNPSHDHG